MSNASSSTPRPANSPPRGWHMVVLKAIVLVLVVWFVGSTLRRAIDDLQKANWRLNVTTIGVSAVLYLVGLTVAGYWWWWLLRQLNQQVRPLAALRAYFVGHLGKYVPGKAMVVVLRAGLLRSSGADVALASVAVIIETLTMMASGAFVALILVAALVPPDWKLALAALLAVATGGPTMPPLLNRLLRRMDRKRLQTRNAVDRFEEGAAKDAQMEDQPALPARETTVAWRVTINGWLAMSVVWLALGLSLAFLLAGLSAEWTFGFEHFLVATAAVALATVAGFLSLLPGGLVVRELILLDLLAPEVGEATALVAAILLRLVWLISELLSSGVLLALGGLPRR